MIEKIKLYGKKGKNVETKHLYANEKGKSVDQQLAEIEGKAFNHTKFILKKEHNLSIINYHLELREKAGFKNDNIIDLGEIFEKLFALCLNWKSCPYCVEKSCKEWYYPIWMIIASKLVVFEDFDACKDNMKDLVEYSFRKAIEKGLHPNFVMLPGSKAFDWYMTKPEKEGGVPDEVGKIIEEIVKTKDP